MDTTSHDSSNDTTQENETHPDFTNNNAINNSVNNSFIEKSEEIRTESNGDSDRAERVNKLNNVTATITRTSADLENSAKVNGELSVEDDNVNNDKEIEELSKLRCQSVATEVVAERYKRRCSDYPGLAFGRSIFSSNTIMKFSVIKNELHNIMNVQLRRVSILA